MMLSLTASSNERNIKYLVLEFRLTYPVYVPCDEGGGGKVNFLHKAGFSMPKFA